MTASIDDANGGAGAVAGTVEVVVVTRAAVVGVRPVVDVVDGLVDVDSLDDDEPESDVVFVAPVARTGSPVVSRTTR